jgi:uncharacterized damage-inducible protein DinB
MNSVDAPDREQILKLLAESRDALLDSVAGLSDEQSRICPAPNRWSVLGIVEHVAIAEHFLFTTIATNLAPAPPSGDRGREEFFLREVTNRNRKISAPDRAYPTGRFPTLAAALEQFNQSRTRGPLTGQEYLIILALHPARHAAQIREVRQTHCPASL